MTRSDIVCYLSQSGEVVTNVKRRITLHSPDGFSWGYCGSGPADFALNILSNFIGQEEAERDGLYQRFKERFVATLPKEGGVIKRAVWPLPMTNICGLSRWPAGSWSISTAIMGRATAGNTSPSWFPRLSMPNTCPAI